MSREAVRVFKAAEEDVSQSPVTSSRWTAFLDFVSSLRLEPMVALSMFAMIVRMIGYQQLAQDKICNQGFNKSLDYCAGLSYIKSDPSKNDILTKTTAFITTKELILLVPNVVMGMFVGSWCDRFKSGRMLVLYATVFGNFLESALLALNSYYFSWPAWILLMTGLPSALMGNGFLIVSISYLSSAVKSESRAFRFLLFEIFVYTAAAAGILSAAQIMSSIHPLIRSPFETHNYTETFVVSAVCYALLLPWVHFMVKLPPLQDQKPLLNDNDNQLPVNGTPDPRSKTVGTILAKIFTIEHVKDSWKTVLKKRPKKFHQTLWWLLLYLNIIMIPVIGAIHIYYPMTEKLYRWSYVEYSKVATMGTLLKPISTILILPILFKLFKPGNLQISMIGTVSAILGSISMGSIVSSGGFYLGTFFSAFAGIGSVGVRAYMADFIPGQEISRISSILMTIELIQPFLGSLVYSSIFKLTINFYPTCAFHFTCFLLILALMIVCWIDVFWHHVPPKAKTKSVSEDSVASMASTSSNKE